MNNLNEYASRHIVPGSKDAASGVQIKIGNLPVEDREDVKIEKMWSPAEIDCMSKNKPMQALG